MPSFFTKLPYLITGDSYEQLKKYDPNSRKKINILGWFAFIPSFLWFLSSFLLCYKILQTGVGVALLAGFIAAAMIFIFERNIVQSNKTHAVLTFMRITLGLFIAIFSSVILDLVIFENDISNYAKEKLISQGAQRVKDASINVGAARDNFNREMEGVSGSKKKGFGRIAKEKKDQVMEAKTSFLNTESDQGKLNTVLADPNHPDYQKTVGGMGLNTILNRVKLLHEFVSQNSLAFWAWFVLLMVGILMEVFGVLTKCFYSQSAYEEDMEAITIMMANKRRIALEQSLYYTNLGVKGRDALDSMKNRNQSILN